VLQQGDQGEYIQLLQYYLAVIGYFVPSVPVIATDGSFGAATRDAVLAFQQLAGLPQDGIVGENTWDLIYEAYIGIIRTLPETQAAVLYPGYLLTQGSAGEPVALIQRYLNEIGRVYTTLPQVTPTGYFGAETRRAVLEFQRIFGIRQTGNVGLLTWNQIISVYDDVRSEISSLPGQFAGEDLMEGMRDGG